MFYIDYNWNLDQSGIQFDKELNINTLGCKANDYFQLVELGSDHRLRKIDSMTKFIMDGQRNE